MQLYQNHRGDIEIEIMESTRVHNKIFDLALFRPHQS